MFSCILCLSLRSYIFLFALIDICFRRRRRCFCKVSEWTHVLATIRQNYFRSRRSTSSRWPSSPCLFRFLIASFSRSWTASIANRLRCSALVSGRAVRVLIGQLCRGVIFVNEERKLERCCNSIKEGRGLHVCAVRNCYLHGPSSVADLI